MTLLVLLFSLHYVVRIRRKTYDWKRHWQSNLRIFMLEENKSKATLWYFHNFVEVVGIDDGIVLWSTKLATLIPFSITYIIKFTQISFNYCCGVRFKKFNFKSSSWLIPCLKLRNAPYGSSSSNRNIYTERKKVWITFFRAKEIVQRIFLITTQDRKTTITSPTSKVREYKNIMKVNEKYR